MVADQEEPLMLKDGDSCLGADRKKDGPAAFRAF
jgi:hypothetical protein